MFRPKITTLYKYREFSSNSLELLIENQIWVSCISKFNDPLEMYFSVKIDASSKKIERHYPNNEISEWLESQRIEVLQNLKNYKQGVFCLSEQNDISLMWGHYTNGHTGLCIGYERNVLNPLGNIEICHPVSYAAIPILKLSEIHAKKQGDEQAMDSFITKLFLNKDPNWRYEKEWRITFKEKDVIKDMIVPISSITFGYKMSPIRRKIVRNLLADKKAIEYFEAVPSKSSYDMKIIPID